jgi:hypothetical protein
MEGERFSKMLMITSFDTPVCACHMRRRIHACHMRRRIHACHMRRRIHACHMRRIHAHDHVFRHASLCRV